MKLHLISSAYIKKYSNECFPDFGDKVHALQTKLTYTLEDFEYYLIASSLYSSKIEGNTLDVNSFFRNKDNIQTPKRKEVEEIENLIKAYQLATTNDLNLQNLLEAHLIASATLVPKEERGKIRKVQVGIRDSGTMRPVYMAVEPEYVRVELEKLFQDIKVLSEEKMTVNEVFYYASMIHLWIAFIHPFTDGNGRMARLVEKWFLTSKLGKNLWSVNSEKYYWDNRPQYYQNISLGYNYYALNWERCMPFLLMLPNAILKNE